MPIYKIAQLSDLQELDINKPLMLDTETSKLGSDIVLIQLYQSHLDKVLIFNVKGKEYLVPLLWEILKDYHLVAHNGLYDWGCFKTDIQSQGGTFTYPQNIDDTFYLTRLAIPQWKKFSLDNCYFNLMRYDPYGSEGLDKKVLQKSFADTTNFTDSQYKYAAIDVYYLEKLYDKVKEKKDDFNYKLDMRIAEFSVQMQDNGMPVDLEELAKIEQTSNKKFNELTIKLKGLNSASYMQVRKALGTEKSSDGTALAIIATREGGFEGLKMLQKVDGEWEMSVVEPNYAHTQEKAIMAKNIISMREVRMDLSYVKRTHAAMNSDNRITAQFSPHAVSARVQPNNENLSQWPRRLKHMWGFKPKDGLVMVYSDFSQLELRSVCAVVGEHNMYEAYIKGEDLHTKTQRDAKIDASKVPPKTNARFVAKMINFLSLYGGSVNAFQSQFIKMAGVWMDTPVVAEILKNWKEVYSDITLWHKENASKLNSGETTGHTVCGRPYTTKSFTEFNNIQIQGSGAEVAKYAWNLLYKFGIVNNEGISGVEIKNTSAIRIINFTHDSYIIECPDDEEVYEKVAYQLMLCMQWSWFTIMANAKIKNLPMPCDSAVDRNWGVIEYGKPQYKADIDGMLTYGKTLNEFKEMLWQQ